MKAAYPTQKINPNSYDSNGIMCTLAAIKSVADTHAVQIEMTIKPTGIKVTLIKKEPDKTVRKRSFECENANLGQFYMSFQRSLGELLAGAMQQSMAMPMPMFM